MFPGFINNIKTCKSLLIAPHFNVDLGLCGTFLPCCLFCNTAKRMGHNGLEYVLVSFVVPCIPMLFLRGEMRGQYGIDGSTSGDACASLCCAPCVNCQMADELDQRS